MKKTFSTVWFIIIAVIPLLKAHAQSPAEAIQEKEITRIENILADDSMQGRKIFTPGIEKASRFIESEFRQIGLDTLVGDNGYRQEITLSSIHYTPTELTVDGKPLGDSAVIIGSTKPGLHWTQADHIKTVTIGPEDNIMQLMRENLKPEANTIVWVDPKFAATFARLKGYLEDRMIKEEMPYSVAFILHAGKANSFSLKAESKKTIKKANNVVGILPGKTHPDQYVIFSAHYDHLGIGTPQQGDSIYNGANDDASGTTAVIALAKYFKEKKDNARTLVFVTFTGEEEGGYGSHYFSEQMDPAKVVAMFNIEMIGTESKWGKNSAYITGYDKTDFGKILQQNLAGTTFTFHPDPYPAQHLFYRSDNATLARQGVPAHTISTSKMDNEPNYHQLSDEVSTLDMDNMTAIIRAIALSATSIISGRDTPGRVAAEDLEK